MRALRIRQPGSFRARRHPVEPSQPSCHRIPGAVGFHSSSGDLREKLFRLVENKYVVHDSAHDYPRRSRKATSASKTSRSQTRAINVSNMQNYFLVYARRRFPPPWSVEELDACSVVTDRRREACTSMAPAASIKLKAALIATSRAARVRNASALCGSENAGR
jgi:hypothetical protein